MSSLGDVVMLSHVRVQTTSDVDAANAERLERLLMLFRGVLLVLSVTSRVSGYIYKVDNCAFSVFLFVSHVSYDH